MTLYEILERWDELPTLARLRCTECGRLIGRVKATTEGNVVRAGKAKRWEAPDGYDITDPPALFSRKPWGVAAFCGSTPESLDGIFHGFPPAWCPHCNNGCTFHVEAAPLK